MPAEYVPDNYQSIDVSTLWQRMNAIRAANADEALRLIHFGRGLISLALQDAGSFGGGRARLKVKDELERLRTLAETMDARALFPELAAVKDAIGQAAIESNAVAQGNATLARARGKILEDLAAELAKMAAAAGTAISVGLSLGTIVLVLAGGWMLWQYGQKIGKVGRP